MTCSILPKALQARMLNEGEVHVWSCEKDTVLSLFFPVVILKSVFFESCCAELESFAQCDCD